MPVSNLFKVYRMKNEVSEPALSDVITYEKKFVDHLNGPSSANKNAEHKKEVLERCREMKLQLERCRRLL